MRWDKRLKETKCLAMMENTTLLRVPVGAVSHLDGALPHFSCCVRVALDREFSNRWIGRRDSFSSPLVLLWIVSSGCL